MIDAAEFWINCKLPAFLSSFSHLQVIQNLAPSTILWCQCDIQMALLNSFFSVFIVLYIYFATTLRLGTFLSIDLIQPQTKTKTLDQEYTEYWLGEVLKP